MGHEKRRRVLERVFFHDILNTLAAARMVAQASLHASGEAVGTLAGTVARTIDQAMDQIDQQRQLLAAEGPVVMAAGAIVSQNAVGI